MEDHGGVCVTDILYFVSQGWSPSRLLSLPPPHRSIYMVFPTSGWSRSGTCGNDVLPGPFKFWDGRKNIFLSSWWLKIQEVKLRNHWPPSFLLFEPENWRRLIWEGREREKREWEGEREKKSRIPSQRREMESVPTKTELLGFEPGM